MGVLLSPFLVPQETPSAARHTGPFYCLSYYSAAPSAAAAKFLWLHIKREKTTLNVTTTDRSVHSFSLQFINNTVAAYDNKQTL